MSADTLPDGAFGPALEAANGTYADGTPLTFEDAIERALLAAAGAIAAQQRDRDRAALERHMQTFTDSKGIVLCGGCLRPAPCPDSITDEKAGRPGLRGVA